MTKEEIGEVLKQLRMSCGMTQKEVATKISRTQQIVGHWETGYAQPDANTLFTLCKIYGTTVDEAFGFSSKTKKFSIGEINIIEKYHNLDPIGQSHVDAVLQWETERVQQIEQAASTVVEVADSDSQGRVLQYFHSVSAGAGEVLFDDVYTERITVPNKPQYHRVAYAVKVSGHSMEPLYHDKDILLVEPTCEISVGEIGIFNVNGQAYVKKLGKGKLISLNKGYDDIPLTEESLCMGRVVDSLKS